MLEKIRKSVPVFSLVVRFLLLAAVFYSCVVWFRYDVTAKSLNADEVIWVLDAEVYEKYQQRDFSFFSLTSDTSELLDKKWYSSEYRLVDQPQAGKYILGFILSIADLQPWKSEQKAKLYYDFSKMNLPEEVPKDAVGESILLLRKVHKIVAFCFFVLLTVAFHRVAKNVEISLVLLLLLVSHWGLFDYATYAVVDVYSWIFQFLTVVAMYHGFKNIQKSKLINVVKWAVAAGAATAIATSVKLNGAFLVLIPYVISFSYVFKAMLQKSTVSKKTFIKSLVWLFSYAFSGLVIFFVLEPELWSSPIKNTFILFEIRILQQQRFLQFFKDLSFLEIGQKIIETLFQVKPYALFITLVIFIKNFPLVIKTNLKKILFLGLLLSSIIIATFYYGRVGFDRYFFPATISIYVLFLLFLGNEKNASEN